MILYIQLSYTVIIQSDNKSFFLKRCLSNLLKKYILACNTSIQRDVILTLGQGDIWVSVYKYKYDWKPLQTLLINLGWLPYDLWEMLRKQGDMSSAA